MVKPLRKWLSLAKRELNFIHADMIFPQPSGEMIHLAHGPWRFLQHLQGLTGGDPTIFSTADSTLDMLASIYLESHSPPSFY